MLVNEDGTKPWKFPGGYVNHGESVKDGAVRELWEETGIDAEFQGIMAIRELKKTPRYSTADFYIICLLKPKNVNQ